MPHPDGGADRDAEEDARPPGEAPVLDRQRETDAHDGRHRPRRQVDLAHDDDEQHAERHDEDVRPADDDVLQVLGVQSTAARLPGEERHDDDQEAKQRVLPHVRAEELSKCLHCLLFLLSS